MMKIFLAVKQIKISISLKAETFSITTRDQKGEKQEDTFKEEEFVNSEILSLTTQSDLGVLVPPLNLTFRHIQNVRFQLSVSTLSRTLIKVDNIKKKNAYHASMRFEKNALNELLNHTALLNNVTFF